MKALFPLFFLPLFLCVSCSTKHPDVPRDFQESSLQAEIFPDYTDVTVPANIAPLNFMAAQPSVRACVAQVDFEGGSRTYGNGRKVIFDEEEWTDLLRSAKGSSLQVTFYAQDAEGKWTRYQPFRIYIAADEIDPWLSYRLIEPSYVAYETIDLMQRNLTSFEESVIRSNRQNREQCLNCHSYQNYHTANMLYHVRGKGGGTMLIYKHQAQLMTAMRREGMISNPVYPSWHPTLPLIAFSTNKTGQLFHTQNPEKIEVQDSQSELVLYDVERDSMIRIPSPIEEFENFPTWSPDGRQLYYTSAHYEKRDTAEVLERDLANHYQELKYNLYVRDFNADSLKFSERRLVSDEAAIGQSATLPRVSPDGKYLLFASGSYGCFHIWHPDADIRLLNLETMQPDSLQALNSPRAESYPSWSSNGRWILMASRRDDGNYSRVYIAYFDRNGLAHKAFAVPQADPEHDKLLLKSYNRPETMLEKVITGRN